jgi:parvulin-like peptidyl-prolyl isomerase
MIKETPMKKIMILIVAVAFVAAGCSSKKEAPMKMAAGTPAYELAKDLTAALPALDPEKTVVIVTSKKFDVSVGDVLQMFLDSMGKQAQGLKGQDPQRIKTIIERAGIKIGERKLLLEAAAVAKKSASPEEIQTALEAQYTRAGGENQYLELVRSNGVSLEYIKRGVAEDLTINKYLDVALAESAKVTEADLQKAYGEDKTASVRHILLLTQGKSEAEKAEIRKKMEGILARAQKGEDFAGLAKEFSEDPGSKANGGLYEDFGRGKMVKPFEDASFSVPVGQISGIVETTYGYHIIKVENRKKETQPFDQVKAKLEGEIKQQRKNVGLDALLTQLKKKADFRAVGIK